MVDVNANMDDSNNDDGRNEQRLTDKQVSKANLPDTGASITQSTESVESEDRSPQKKIGMIVLGGVVAIAILIALTPLWGLLIFSFAMSVEEEFQIIRSPDSKHELHVHHTGAFGYGSHSIILRVKKGRKTLAKHNTHLSNDGKNLLESNIQAHWQNETLAYICLKGEEQDPAGISLKLEPQDGRFTKTQAVFADDPKGCQI